MREISDFFRLANPFGHPSQVRTQVLVLQTRVDLRRLASPFGQDFTTKIDKAGSFSKRSPRLLSLCARNVPLLQVARPVARLPASTTWKPRCVGTFVPKTRHSVDSNPGKTLAENQVSFKFKFRQRSCYIPVPLGRFNRFCVTIPTRHSRSSPQLVSMFEKENLL